MNSEKRVTYNGVIVGFDTLDDYGKTLYVQGEVNGRATSFYLLVPDKLYREYEVKGVGVMISGKGVLLNNNPLVIKYLGDTRDE